jgi:hypothetical protein
MNFTKEYIKECDCREIQELLDDLIEKGSYYLERNSGYVNLANHYTDNEGNIWLPTGDQLDQEIVQILRYNGYYQLTYDHPTGWKAKLHFDWRTDEMVKTQNDNPLIAKIKLLKSLLKEE